MVLKLSLKLSILLNTKPYSREVLGILLSAKNNPCKKNSRLAFLTINSRENLSRLGNLKSFVIQNVSLTKISNTILTQFQSI